MDIITHTDTDGVISAAIALKKLNTRRIYFSSPFLLRATVAEVLKTTDFKGLYVFDISPSETAVKLASVFEKVVWIDHHVTEIKKYPENFDVLIRNLPSAARLVSEYFGIEDELVKIADEVDTARVKSEEAAWIRDYIAALKFNFKGSVFASALRDLVFRLIKDGISVTKNETMNSLVKKYREWVSKQKNQILNNVKIEEFDGKKFAFIKLSVPIPTYIVVEELAKLEEAPFDLIISVTEKNGFVHLEFRTHTGFKVLDLAKYFGGGGHDVAAGATFKSGIDLIGEIKKFFSFCKK